MKAGSCRGRCSGWPPARSAHLPPHDDHHRRSPRQPRPPLPPARGRHPPGAARRQTPRSRSGDALLVKGSGTDLRTIGRDGFTRLSLARLAPLAEAETMSDADMMRFMAGCMLAEGPAPSVETPLHSLLPHRVIAHTHDVATMSLTNVRDAHGRAAGARAVRRRHRLRPVQPARLPARASGERDGGPDSRRTRSA